MDTATLCSQALCVGLDVHVFVPNTDDVRARNRAVTNPPPFVLETCQQVCPVRGECLHYGIESGSSGWWGGFLLHQGGPVTSHGHIDRVRAGADDAVSETQTNPEQRREAKRQRTLAVRAQRERPQ